MGKGGGKSIGKTIFSVAGFFFGVGSLGQAIFGASGWLAGGILGASLFGSIWNATHQQDLKNNSSPDIQRFDKAQETMTSSAMIPVVYGYRKLSGNQTFHETNADQNTLHKHVVICEGGIEGIESISANDLLIPTGTQTENTVFTVRNTMYTDATVRKSGKHMYLFCNGVEKDLYLANKDDASSADTLWSWQTSVPELISYINKIGDGWEAFPTATTSKYPGDLKDVGQSNCYNNPINIIAETVTGGTEYTFHDCQTPSNYEEVGGYPMMAWLDMTFMVSNELNGNPSVSCFIKGKKVLDTRTGQIVYTTNPAMCLRDFILSKRYGLGRWISADNIDEDSFKEVADYCDEYITYTGTSGQTISCKRYELNIVIDEKQSALDWITSILGNFGGFLVFSQDKFYLRIEKPEPISYKFDDSNCSDLSVAPLSLEDTPNYYAISFVDPLNNWKSVEVLVEDFADQKNRGKIVSKEVTLEGTTSQNQALRLARFYRDYNAVCFKTISFKTGFQAMHLEPGDVISLSYHNVFKDEPFRINEIKENNDGTFEISARSYNEDLYNDYLGATIQTYNYTTITNPITSNVPEVKNITLSQSFYVNRDGTVLTSISGTVTLPVYEYFKDILIYYSIDNGSNWIYLASVAGNQFVMNGVRTDTSYMFKIIVENTSNRQSSGVISESIYITGKNTPPSNVTSGNVAYSGNIATLTWSAVSDTDVSKYEIQNENNLVIGTVYSPSFSYTLNDNNVHIFYVYAIDNSGNRSASPLTLTAQIPSTTGGE